MLTGNRSFRTDQSDVSRSNTALTSLVCGLVQDNGAFYYGDAYPQGSRSNPDYNLSCCTRQKLLSARQGLLDDGIALQYLQLDDWWCVVYPTVRIIESLQFARYTERAGICICFRCAHKRMMAKVACDCWDTGTTGRTRRGISGASSVSIAGSCLLTPTQGAC